MSEKAEYYNKQGLRLFTAGQLQEAVEFFTKAIKIDPQFPDAYHNRGRVFLKTNRTIDGNADIQKAKDLRSEKSGGKSEGNLAKKPEKTVKLNWQEVENIYDTVFPIGYQGSENDPLEFEDSFDDDFFLDDTIVTEKAREGLVKPTHEIRDYPAILELVNGKRLEVARAGLFEPTNNDISIIRQDGYAERVVPLEHMACIRMAGIPPVLNKNKNSLCHVEIIETVDGTIYHVAVYPEQDHENVLFGFSTEEQSRFIYTFIPTVNIRKRCQDRCLGEILLEKGFIGNDILKGALAEHQQLKRVKLGKIIAHKAKVIYSAIEEALKQAKQKNDREGLKTGEILLTTGLVDEEQVLEALQHQKYLRNMKIGQFLVKKGVIQEKEVCIALAEKFRIPFIDLKKKKISRKTLTLLSNSFVLQNEIIPISLDNDILTVATLHPDVSYLREAIIKECECKDVRFVLALPTHLRIILDLLAKKSGTLKTP
ncbi:MAG: tetratricopeptide repeat protein [Desulfobulbaceae bacterium]|nr:tetratricopeptide repeat protein [Desulfobulbaceae bacterium]